MSEYGSPDARRPLSPLVLSAIALAFVAGIGSLYKQFTSRSARPSPIAHNLPSPLVPLPFNSRHSPLWEDPLRDAISPLSALSDQRLEPAIKALSFDERPPNQGFRPAELVKAIQVNEKQLRNAWGPVINGTENGSVQLMPIMLPGGASPEEREKRLRIRYSVMCALSVAGYHLDYARRMTYMDVPVFVETRRNPVYDETNQRHPARQVLTIPVKLYSRGSPCDDALPKRVIILWLNEVQLGMNPIWTIAQILEAMLDGTEGVKPGLCVVGPTDSTELAVMSDEEDSYKARHDYYDVQFSCNVCDVWNRAQRTLSTKYFADRFCEPTVLSQFATASETKIWPMHAGKIPVEPDSRSGFFYLRVNGSDNCLVELIADELQAREKLVPGGQVVLIHEFDSTYGNSFYSLFEQALKKSKAGEKAKQTSITQVGYMKGIDGIFIRGADDSSSESASGITPQEPGTRAIFAEGVAQKDYLVRLQQHLLNAQKHGGEITAIGLVGTDVYDKLLILRVLRPSFPKATFFTTDLDASFLHAEEYPSTRNLIVASHFGLSLARRIQNSAPVFRDCYQTATFLAILSAVKCTDDEKALVGLPLRPEGSQGGSHDPWANNGIPACLFEIGRDCSCALIPAGVSEEEDTKEALYNFQPEIDRIPSVMLTEVLVIIAIGLGVAALLFVAKKRILQFSGAIQILIVTLGFCLPWIVASFIWWFPKPDAVTVEPIALSNSRVLIALASLAVIGFVGCVTPLRRVVWKSNLVNVALYSLATMLLILLVIVAGWAWAGRVHNLGGEPLGLWQGISSWPLFYSRIIISVVALVFLWSTWLRHSSGWKDVVKKTPLSVPQQNRAAKAVNPTKVDREQKKPRSLKKWVMVLSRWAIMRLKALYRSCPSDLREQVLFMSPESGEREPNEPDRPLPSEVLLQWERQFSPWVQGARTLLYAFIALTIMVALVMVFGPPEISVRGTAAKWINLLTLIGAGLCGLVLIAYIVNTTEMARVLSRRLERSVDAQQWSKQNYDLDRLRTQVTGVISAVAGMTDRAGGFVWIPFFLLLIWIFSLSRYFDGHYLGLGLWFAWGTLLLFVTLSSWAMKQAAIKCRERVMSALGTRQLVEPEGNQLRALDRLVGWTSTYHRGAFARWYNDPVLQGLAIPISGVSGLQILQLVNKYITG